MFAILRPLKKSRQLTSRLSSLILLFQRSPLVQMLFPEARIIGGAGLGEITKWSVATLAGLGAYDSVAGATTIAQTAPTPAVLNSTNVTTALDSDLVFNFALQGSTYTPVSWTVHSGNPPGLSIRGAGGKESQITGRATVAGTYSTVIRAWQGTNGTGLWFARTFTITVGPAIITGHPISTSVSSGGSTTLSVQGSGSPLTYQWVQRGSTDTLIPGATSATFTTPALTTAANYYVRVTRGGLATATTNPVISISSVATVSILTAVPAAITSGPSSVTIDGGANTTLSVTASGTAPLTYQWYQGSSGVTTTPVGTNQATFTPSPALAASANFWVKVSNAANIGGANSATAVITVRELFATWQNAQFNPTQLANPLISAATADPDGDSITNENEYILGRSPLVSEPGSAPTVTTSATQLALNFTAAAATGPGYFGKTRRYTLQSSSTLTTAAWSDVAGFIDLQGANQAVNFTTPLTPSASFYRVKVELKP